MLGIAFKLAYFLFKAKHAVAFESSVSLHIPRLQKQRGTVAAQHHDGCLHAVVAVSL